MGEIIMKTVFMLVASLMTVMSSLLLPILSPETAAVLKKR
jgi:hypothetical protein